MLSIIYSTSRPQPHIEWFLSSLNSQLSGKTIPLDLVLIDFYNRQEMVQVAAWYPNLPPLRVYPPKPTPWQGAHRRTKIDYFAAASARNTGFIAARGDYFVCVDDLSVLCPGFIDNALHAYAGRYIVYGAYKKVWELKVGDSGEILHYREEPSGVDSRWDKGSANGVVPAAGSWMFGCCFGVPAWCIESLNGVDEKCDSGGGEDWSTGMRLEYLSNHPPFYYNRNLCEFESEEGHRCAENPVFSRIDKLTPGNRFGHDSSHVLLNELQHYRYVYANFNNFDMAAARKKHHETGEFPPRSDVGHHWPDNQPLEDM